MAKIGPDGTFPLGEPINESDKGGLYAAFRTTVLNGRRFGVMDFGTVVTWVGLPIAEARQFADMIRHRTIEAFGTMPYDKSTLPIKISANREKGVIEMTMPSPVQVMAANPEMWIAWAEVIDDVLDGMT